MFSSLHLPSSLLTHFLFCPSVSFLLTSFLSSSFIFYSLHFPIHPHLLTIFFFPLFLCTCSFILLLTILSSLLLLFSLLISFLLFSIILFSFLFLSTFFYSLSTTFPSLLLPSILFTPPFTLIFSSLILSFLHLLSFIFSSFPTISSVHCLSFLLFYFYFLFYYFFYFSPSFFYSFILSYLKILFSSFSLLFSQYFLVFDSVHLLLFYSAYFSVIFFLSFLALASQTDVKVNPHRLVFPHWHTELTSYNAKVWHQVKSISHKSLLIQTQVCERPCLILTLLFEKVSVE